FVQVLSFRRYSGHQFCPFRDQRKLEVLGQDANDGERFSIQSKLPAQGRLVAAKSALPILVADNNDRLSAALLFLGLKIAASGQSDPEHREKVGSDPHSLNSLGLAFIEHIEPIGLITRYPVKTPTLLMPVLKLEVRDISIGELVHGCSPDRCHAVGFDDRRRTQNQCIDEAEDRRIRANPERECKDSNQRKTWLLQQPSRAVTQVLAQSL